jgi:hypothetical protein
MKQIVPRNVNLVSALGHATLQSQHAANLVEQSLRQVAHAPLARLGVRGGNEHAGSTEVEVAKPNADKLTNSAAQLVEHAQHELVSVVFDAIENSIPFRNGQVADGFTESFVAGPRKAGFHI